MKNYAKRIPLYMVMKIIPFYTGDKKTDFNGKVNICRVSSLKIKSYSEGYILSTSRILFIFFKTPSNFLSKLDGVLKMGQILLGL